MCVIDHCAGIGGRRRAAHAAGDVTEAGGRPAGTHLRPS